MFANAVHPKLMFTMGRGQAGLEGRVLLGSRRDVDTKELCL